MGSLNVHRAAGAVALVCLGGCPGTRYKSDTNAPGIVHLEAPPPYENGRPERYVEAEDPGEHQLYLGPGVILGPASGRDPDPVHGEFELSLQVRIAYEVLTRSHRSKEPPFPRKGWALDLGFSPIQTGHTGDDLEVHLGPVYAEIERYWWYLSIGAGAVAYTQDWDGGIQVTGNAGPYGFRVRYLADGGWEYMAAFRLELPAAINWSR